MTDLVHCIRYIARMAGFEITPVHEEAMRQAKEENEKNGIFFKEDGDVW